MTKKQTKKGKKTTYEKMNILLNHMKRQLASQVDDPLPPQKK